ncbi:LysR family transcriptional regulator [Bacillus altitudinis]|uniref:LysR family transcriptional regulator n=1 Tax=Bacillus altitudinis TaxID=293387 RepID=UPI0034592F10
MEIKQLMMFQTASKVLNFTKTAQILGYAQSSITANIAALEEELGTPLFERLGKRSF